MNILPLATRLRAIELFKGGMSCRATAAEVGISRQTAHTIQKAVWRELMATQGFVDVRIQRTHTRRILAAPGAYREVKPAVEQYGRDVYLYQLAVARQEHRDRIQERRDRLKAARLAMLRKAKRKPYMAPPNGKQSRAHTRERYGRVDPGASAYYAQFILGQFGRGRGSPGLAAWL